MYTVFVLAVVCTQNDMNSNDNLLNCKLRWFEIKILIIDPTIETIFHLVGCNSWHSPFVMRQREYYIKYFTVGCQFQWSTKNSILFRQRISWTGSSSYQIRSNIWLGTGERETKHNYSMLYMGSKDSYFPLQSSHKYSKLQLIPFQSES